MQSAHRLLVPTCQRAFTRCFSSVSVPFQYPKAELPKLPYDYSALEPVITRQIMEAHHGKHHQTYVNNLNNALAQYAEAEKNNDIERMTALQGLLRFNGGGHVNHSIFWSNLAPIGSGGGGKPTGELLTQIEKDFGSFDKFKELLTNASVTIQGSGWGWLGYNKQLNRLEVTAKANQDPLTELVPLLCFDVWEHAYYFKYGPARADFIKNLWDIVNWANVTERLQKAKQK